MSLVVGFDLDLTLVDSAEGIAATYIESARRVGSTVTREQMVPLIGLPLPETMGHLVPAAAVDEAVRTYRALYPELGVPGTKILPGAAEAVTAVREAGGRPIVVSAKIESAVRLVLDHVGLEVAGVVGERFAETKGDALREYGAAAHVGDHPGDMIGARTAGACAVGVTTGSHDAVQLREAGADVVFADLLDFPYWLDDFIKARADG